MSEMQTYMEAAVENAATSCTYVADLDRLAERGLNADLLVLLYTSGPGLGGGVVKTLKEATDGEIGLVNKVFEETQ